MLDLKECQTEDMDFRKGLRGEEKSQDNQMVMKEMKKRMKEMNDELINAK